MIGGTGMGMLDKVHTGELYFPGEKEVFVSQRERMDLQYEFNNTKPSEIEKRMELAQKMFAEFGEGSFVEAPFYANCGGKHCHFGKHIYVNFNLTCVDDTHIYIGDYTMIGPNVTIASAAHPIQPELRKQGYQYNKPVHIGQNCWIGAGVIIVPGITIGDNVVIGAGSVVTKDIPSNVVAVGNPCRILREVNQYD